MRKQLFILMLSLVCLVLNAATLYHFQEPFASATPTNWTKNCNSSTTVDHLTTYGGPSWGSNGGTGYSTPRFNSGTGRKANLISPQVLGADSVTFYVSHQSNTNTGAISFYVGIVNIDNSPVDTTWYNKTTSTWNLNIVPAAADTWDANSFPSKTNTWQKIVLPIKSTGNIKIVFANNSISAATYYFIDDISLSKAKLTKPDVTTGASDIGNTSFTANWASVTNATGYNVYVYQGTTQVASALNVSGTNTTISTGLIQSTAYTYKVVAINGSSYNDSDPSDASASFSTTGSLIVLNTPTSLVSNTITASGFTATWTGDSHASSYDVILYRSGVQVGSTINTSNTSYSFTGLTNLTTYTYTVQAKGDMSTYNNSVVSSSSSNIVTLDPNAVTSINTTFSDGSWGTTFVSPNPTSGAYPTYSINGFDLNQTCVYVSNSTGPKGEVHTAYLKLDKGNLGAMITMPTVVNVNQLEIHANNVSNATARTFTLQQYIGNSWTNIGAGSGPGAGLYDLPITQAEMIYVIPITNNTNAKFRILNTATQSGSINVMQIITRIATPTTLSAPTVGTGNSITASGFTANWSTGDTNAQGYKVLVYNSSGSTFINSFETANDNSIRSFATTGLTSNTNYTYKVLSKGDGDTNYSDSYVSGLSAVILTLPAVPTSSAATFPTTNGFTANWTAPTQGSVSFTYTLQYSTVSDLSSGTTDISSIASSNLSSTISNLASNTTYYYRIKAVNTSGSGVWSSIQSITTLPPAPAITSFSPSTAANGTTVIITGTNFTNASAVSFGGTAASSYTVDSDTQITAVVSTGANGNVSITTPGGTGTKAGFTWLEPATTVSTSQNATDLSLTASSIVTISSGSTLTIDQNTSTNSITVNPGGKLTLASGKTLTSGTLSLQSNAAGTATFVDNNINSPQAITANVQQYLPQGRNWYVACSVGNAVSSDLSTGTSVVSYNEELSTWNTETGTLTPGKGYISVSSAGTGTSNVSFDGTLNTGNINVSVTRLGATKSGFNLVGNPYPSYLDWSMVDTTAAKIISTIWYRTKTVAKAYTFDTYNGTADIATTNGVNTVSNLVPPMQAFWIRVKAGETSGTLTFTNAMRKHGDVTGNLLKMPEHKSAVQKVLRLQVSNGVNNDEAIVLFNANASNGYDAYDSPKMMNGSIAIPEIYTTVGTENLVINGLNAIIPDLELPLGFTTGESNSFTIKATQISNFDPTINVILKDNLLNASYNLTDGSAYNFTSDAVSPNTSRFSVIFRSASITTGATANSDISPAILAYRNLNNQIVLKCQMNLVGEGSISVYNAVGQKLEIKSLTSSTTTLNNTYTSGIYFVSVVNNGKVTTQKVVIN